MELTSFVQGFARNLSSAAAASNGGSNQGSTT
jgi:hypothetical protein